MEKVSFGSVWFVAALAVALVNLVVGMVARTSGGIKLMSLQTVCEDWLHHSEWEFKQLSVYWAGRHFEHNTNVVNKKRPSRSLDDSCFSGPGRIHARVGLGRSSS